MKILGREINGEKLVGELEARLRARGLLPTAGEVASRPEGSPHRVDPLAYNLAKLDEHADSTRGMPLHTHRSGLGRAVLLAKWAFRKTGQIFINEALARQRVFNGHVRDSYAQLSAEVIRMREELTRIRNTSSMGQRRARPAGESIARLSAELARLRTEVDALREASTASPAKPAPRRSKGR